MGLARLDNGWDADGDAVVRDVADDDCVGTDEYVVADADVAQQFGASTYINIVTQQRGAWVADSG